MKCGWRLRIERGGAGAGTRVRCPFAADRRGSVAGRSVRGRGDSRSDRRRVGAQIETLAVVGRPSIELKELSLPPAPDDELPDLVRFQALRDFTHLADDTPLDYLPLPVEGDEHRNVLAAAISVDLLKEIRATCSQAGLELNHLVLRPCAAASLLCRHRPAPRQIRMFVDLLGDEVDLTVLDRDSPILMRTTRLPGDASQPEYTRPVFLEIRRTIASVQNKLHGRRVEAIALCGDGPSQQMLADLIRTELDLPTEHFDPFTAFELAGGMKKHMPERHSQLRRCWACWPTRRRVSVTESTFFRRGGVRRPSRGVARRRLRSRCWRPCWWCSRFGRGIECGRWTAKSRG